MRQASQPRLTQAIALVTALAWIIATLLTRQNWAELQLGFIALRATVSGPFIVPFLLTPLTATLVHGGLLHLGFNLLLFLFAGRQVEEVVGWRGLALLYICGAYGAAAAQYAFNPAAIIPMVGASGAISAVLALYALLYGRDEIRSVGPFPAHWVRAAWLAAAWIGLQALTALATRGGDFLVATPAHVGGFIVGLLLARPLLRLRYRRP